MGTGLCRICGKHGKLNKEHIYTRWARKLVRDVLPEAQKDLPTNPSRPICETCNSALGDAFEVPCKPVMSRLIGGEDGVLTTADQFLAVRWMVKTNIVTRLTDAAMEGRNARPEVTEILRGLLQMMIKDPNLGPPASLRIGCMLPLEGDYEVQQFSTMPDVLNRSSPHKQVTHLGFVLWEFVLFESDSSGFLSGTPEDDPRLVQLWPQRHPVIMWPPKQMLDLREAFALRQAWDHFPDAYSEIGWKVDLEALRERHGLG